MSEETKNNQCQICHSYLFDDDDIVICPQCGAPHHRDCWQTVGHCGVENDHGTDRQYDKLAAKQKEEETAETPDRKCRFCGRTSKTSGADFCPYCGQPYEGHGVHHQPPFIINGGAISFDPCGGIPKDTKIEGVTAGDIATFTGNNSARYVNKFKEINKGKKNSWNWVAFLFPSAWSLSRKMYANGILLLILSIASTLCFVPFNQTLNSLGNIAEMTNSSQPVQLVVDNIGAFTWLTWVMCAKGTLLFIIPRIIAGLRGDWMYRSFAIAKIKTIRDDKEVDDYEEELRHSGSVSLMLVIVAILVEDYLPLILTSMLWK